MGGRLLGELTLSKKVLLALSDPSLTLSVMRASPNWSATGVTITVRFDPEPPKTILLSGTNAGFEEAPLTTRVSGAVSTSPMVKPIGPVELFSAMA